MKVNIRLMSFPYRWFKKLFIVIGLAFLLFLIFCKQNGANALTVDTARMQVKWSNPVRTDSLTTFTSDNISFSPSNSNQMWTALRYQTNYHYLTGVKYTIKLRFGVGASSGIPFGYNEYNSMPGTEKTLKAIYYSSALYGSTTLDQNTRSEIVSNFNFSFTQYNQYQKYLVLTFTPIVDLSRLDFIICYYGSISSSNLNGDIGYRIWNNNLMNDAGITSNIYQTKLNTSLTLNVSDTSSGTDTTIIENNTQTIIDNTTKTNEILTDDSVSSDTGTSFFNDFHEQNIGNLTNIITMPLQLYSDIQLGSCDNLNLNFNNIRVSSSNINKNVSLPSVCILKQHAQSTTSYNIVITTIQYLVYGFASFRLLKSLFNTIQDLFDPTKDKVEVADL